MAFYMLLSGSISIHSTTRVETNKRTISVFCSVISIHSTTRVETFPTLQSLGFPGISIHSTTRVETFVQIPCLIIPGFQSTPPRGWRLHLPRFSYPYNYFNPLHHEGGDREFKRLIRIYNISIHSTTRVETVMAHGAFHELLISIHSTTRVETPESNRPASFCPISIHSTTRVETAYPWTVCFRPPVFQSTPPRGWRLGFWIIRLKYVDFNPLHHEGGDGMGVQYWRKCRDFNPLHHEGGDHSRHSRRW